MTILDTYAVLAYLRDEPAAQQVSELIDAGDTALTAVGVAEVLDHIVRLLGADEEEAALDLAALGLLEAIIVDATLGSAAGRLRARHYHRKRCAISMADCIAAESARRTGHSLVTSDPHLLDVCHAEQIPIIVLPGSNGSSWTRPF
jgi:predicted nucleic acid-binding protein